MVYEGLHLMVDARLLENNDNYSILCDANNGKSVLDRIVHRVDMTQILPTICVTFPHAISEMDRTLAMLRSEGLGESKTAQQLMHNLKVRSDQTCGYSAFTMIAESHITLHSFPDEYFFSFDCYSCKCFDVDAVVEVLQDNFGGGTYNVQKVSRLVPELNI